MSSALHTASRTTFKREGEKVEEEERREEEESEEERRGEKKQERCKNGKREERKIGYEWRKGEKAPIRNMCQRRAKKN